MRGLRILLLLPVLLIAPCFVQAQTRHLTAAEAMNHVGETATVCGKVVSARFASKSKGQPTFLNLDEPYPNHIFTVVVWGSDREKFGDIEAKYGVKNVCVSGKITRYRGLPEIAIDDPSQIEIQK
jgi:micrococcal nuclease